jgi:DNA-binding transcriptional LysR family regulator
LIDAQAAKHPELKVAPKEVFAEDIERLLADERIDLALTPHVGHRRVLDQRPIRLEPFVAAVAENHPLAAEPQVPLAALADETIELWPQTMSPGYHDSVVAACRDAGFKPRLDDQAAGSTVGSPRHQLPRGLTLLPLAASVPTLTIDLVWPIDRATPAIRRLIVVADRLAQDQGWLQPTSLRTASAH